MEKKTTTVHFQKSKSSKEDKPDFPSVVSRIKDYIGIAVKIATIIKLCKDIF